MDKEISGFEFKVVFLDEDEFFLSSEIIKIEVPQTDDRESDRDEAQCQVSVWAEKNLEIYGAEDYETRLVDAY